MSFFPYSSFCTATLLCQNHYHRPSFWILLLLFLVKVEYIYSKTYYQHEGNSSVSFYDAAALTEATALAKMVLTRVHSSGGSFTLDEKRAYP